MRIAIGLLLAYVASLGIADAASPILDPIFGDAFDSCQGSAPQGDTDCRLTVKPAQHSAAWYDARCNDGSPASYDLRPSPTASKQWVILLEGGAKCDDLTSFCSQRDPYLTSSSPVPDGDWTLVQHGGILSPNPSVNPDFYDANLVQLHYCSSDLWSGATADLRENSATPQCTVDDGTCGWQFSGRINVRAEIESLKRDHGLIDDGSADVLFVGTSAGGFGLVANAEVTKTEMPNTYAAGGLHYVIEGAFALSDWNQPGHPIEGSSITSVNEVADQNLLFWRAEFETYCEADRTQQGLDPALCTFGNIYYPYLTSTTNGLGLHVLIQNSTLDAIATGELDLTDTSDPARELWRCDMTAALTVAPWLFSSGDVYHTLSKGDSTFQFGPPGGPTFQQLVGSFFRESAPQRVVFDNPPCS